MGRWFNKTVHKRSTLWGRLSNYYIISGVVELLKTTPKNWFWRYQKLIYGCNAGGSEIWTHKGEIYYISMFTTKFCSNETGNSGHHCTWLYVCSYIIRSKNAGAIYLYVGTSVGPAATSSTCLPTHIWLIVLVHETDGI